MNPESTTETYAAIKLEIATRRWAGVPFYLRTGKRLGRRVTEIAVVFNRAPQHLFSRNQTSELGQNALVIRVQPDEGVTIRFGSKVPGSGSQVRDVTMDFGYGHAFTEASPEAYERLILDVLLGDPPLFPRHEEVELSWMILDPGRAVLGRAGRAARAVRPRIVGPRFRRRTSGPRRPRLEAPVIIELPDTTVSKVARQLVKVREEGGAVALGRVLTLIIATRHGLEEEAIDAANDASREHPMRVIVLMTSEADEPRLDAQIRVGGDAGASEVRRAARPRRRVVQRREPRHRAAAAGCARRRLVAGRPAPHPRRTPPSDGIAQRRITDASTGPFSSDRLSVLGDSYGPGDTDLAWTRLTHWREQLAAVLDQPPFEPVTGVEVHGAASSPSTALLAAWLRLKLEVPVDWRYESPDEWEHGIKSVRLTRASGDIVLERPEPGIAVLTQPGQPDHDLVLPRRTLRECLAEELRRLDPDVLYGRVITEAWQLLGPPATREQHGA